MILLNHKLLVLNLTKFYNFHRSVKTTFIDVSESGEEEYFYDRKSFN